jgi:hypothetical protein
LDKAKRQQDMISPPSIKAVGLENHKRILQITANHGREIFFCKNSQNSRIVNNTKNPSDIYGLNTFEYISRYGILAANAEGAMKNSR